MRGWAPSPVGVLGAEVDLRRAVLAAPARGAVALVGVHLAAAIRAKYQLEYAGVSWFQLGSVGVSRS